MKTWWVLWRAVLFRPGLYALNTIFVVAIFLFLQSPGLIIKAFFDNLTENRQAGLEIWSLIALLVGASIGRVVALILNTAIAEAPFYWSINTLLSRNLLEHIIENPRTHTVPQSSGDTISRFRDDVEEIPIFAFWISELLGYITVAVIAFVVMIRINLFITLVALAPIIVVAGLAYAVGARVEKYHKAYRASTGDVIGFLGEVFGAVQAVKVATAEKHVINSFHTLNEARRKAIIQDRLFNELLGLVFYNTVNLGTGIILLLASQSMRTGTFTVGDFSLFVFYLELFTRLMRMLGRAFSRYKQVGVAINRMSQLLTDNKPETLVKPNPIYLRGKLPDINFIQKTGTDFLHQLEALNLTYRYPVSGRGIKGVNLRLKRGSFTVITGRIGSGKTTLLHVLLGLLPKEEGEIRWNGIPVGDCSSFFMPPRSAYVPQVPRLFSGTLKENILLGLPEEKVDITAAIWSAVMERDLKELGDGLNTMVGPRGVKLSGGQIQRTAAARAIVRTPELLIFDDLSSALDVETEQTLWERNSTSSDVTRLVVSHRKTVLHQADHIIVLKQGSVEAEGTLNELLTDSLEMRRLWNSNFNLSD